MTVGIFALDGLDIQYVRERGLLESLEPSMLENDLEGANGLYTYRIWPCIFAGENGGKSEDEEFAIYQPDSPYIWDKYAATVLLAPVRNNPVLQYQDAFPDGYVESVGPHQRNEEKFEMYREGINDALAQKMDLLVFGSKVPDILGHSDPQEDRIHGYIGRLCDMVEETIHRDEISDWLVVSDHGFEYEQFGECPSGVAAHTPRATLASSFADYDSMYTFIEEWHSDLDTALTEQRLEALGYK